MFSLIRRLLLLALRYGWGCAWLMTLQLASILFGLVGLTLAGLAIDAVAWFVAGAKTPLDWPLGLSPPSGWSPTAVIAALAGGVLAAAALRALLNYHLSVSTSGLMQEQLVVEMRAQVYDKLQRLGSRYLGGHGAGSLIARVTSDVQAVRMFVDGVVLPLVVLGLTLAFHVTYMMCIDVRLALLCLATTPVVWLVSTLFCRRVRPAYDRNRELVDQMLLVLSENVRGVQVVKGFAQEAIQTEKFQAANRAVKDQQRRIFWNISLYTPTTEFLLSLNTAVLLGYGGSLVIEGRLSLGAGLIVFAGLLQQLSAQVSKMTNVINSVLQSLAGAQRVFQILDAPIEIRSPAAPVRTAKIRGAIEFDRARFAYQPDRPVLDDIRLRIEPGQCVAVLGATGEGKTTLLHLIPRLLDVTAGGVLIDGVDVRRYDLDDLRRRIGIVYQESFLFSDTVAANIAFGRPDASPDEIRRAAEIASADRFIGRLPDGYQTRLREGGKDLSGGQRQRLAIARALLQDPSILLLDDPTAAIDPGTEKEILAAMEQAMRGRTTLVVAHRVATLRRADLVIVLRGGRIVERGSHDELMARGGSYWRAARLQIDDAPAELAVVR